MEQEPIDLKETNNCNMWALFGPQFKEAKFKKKFLQRVWGNVSID